ncbi:MAG TPA: cytochrome c3 family protein [Candidatus Sulfotelmatobacter sp.]|nr:cytochrome c3 family protein [Candidatus Sulfotelmatobacter sp.]
MKTLSAFVCVALAGAMTAVSSLAQAPQPTGDVLGMHNMTLSSGASAYTQGSLGCTFCHAPHSGLGANTPLWNQKLSQKSYVPYTSTTNPNQGNTQPTLGVTSSLCLSCHDGTVAVGQSAVYGQLPVNGSLNAADSFGTTLTGSHPFSLVTPLKDASNLVATLASGGKTADPTGAVKLIKGNIECTSCHDPHVQSTDKIAQNFLVRDSSKGQMCLACHDPNRVVQGQVNPLAGFTTSIHATAANQVSPDAHAGQYPTVGVNACTSCHMEHNSIAPARLLRPAVPAATSTDPATQDCMTCHGGGTYLSPAIPNVMAELAKVSHPLPSGNNFHDAAEPAVLNNNRHATCVDCHSAHSGNPEVQFAAPPAIRPPQQNATGVSALDGVTVLAPAVNQYETCLRCHGPSIGKQRLIIYGYSPIRMVTAADPLNVIAELAATATSSHPVTHPRSSALPQPSLLVNMLDLKGLPSVRLVGTQIFCTDCHNSDDNREFGGAGPNGPHGSINSHLLERNYQFSQAATPGGPVTNLFPNPDTSVAGPFSMCAKCHNLTQIFANTSFSQHNLHTHQYGFSCSVCHTAHGMGANSPTVTGDRLVNFDVNVVGQNGAAPIAYNRSTNTCTLMCHSVAHNADGSVAAAAATKPRIKIR